MIVVTTGRSHRGRPFLFVEVYERAEDHVGVHGVGQLGAR